MGIEEEGRGITCERGRDEERERERKLEEGACAPVPNLNPRECRNLKPKLYLKPKL